MLVNHLRTCQYQPDEVKTRANLEYSRTSRSPHRRQGNPIRYHTNIDSMSVPGPSTFRHSPYPLPPLSMASSSLSNMIDPSLLSSVPDAVPGLFYQPSPPASWVISVVSSLAPSDSASAVPSRSNSLRWSCSHQSQETVHASLEWSPTHQQRFEERLIRLTASAGFPLSWIENPEWLDLCCDFIPAAKSPSRKTLTRRILPKTLLALRTAVKQTICGQNVTVQCDG